MFFSGELGVQARHVGERQAPLVDGLAGRPLVLRRGRGRGHTSSSVRHPRQLLRRLPRLDGGPGPEEGGARGGHRHLAGKR